MVNDVLELSLTVEKKNILEFLTFLKILMKSNLFVKAALKMIQLQ